MEKEKCDVIKSNSVKEKKMEIIDGYTIKYHTKSNVPWSMGKIINGQLKGYCEWYRADGIIKRSGYFEKGDTVGELVTYDDKGERYKVTQRTKSN